MGYDLTNSAGDYHQWKVIGWWYLLNVAKRYGWQPASTKVPEEWDDSEPWAGGYFRNDSQIVRAEDASALASALESFFNDVCRDEIAGEVAERMQEALNDPSVTPDSRRDDILVEPIDYVRSAYGSGETSIPPWSFTERSNQYLREFISFCRKGAFTIE